MKISLAEADDLRADMAANPAVWIRRMFGVDLWSRQAELLAAIMRESRVACRSGHGIGKSMLAASAALLWTLINPPCYCILTSASWESVIRIIWPTIRYLLSHAQVSIPARPTQTSLELGERWGIFSVSTKTPENFGGFHNDHVLVIVDEASALEADILHAIEGLVTGADDKIVLLGNPLRNSGPFCNAFGSPTWKTYHVSSRETPNVVEGRTVIPGLATREWVKQIEDEWGPGSQICKTRVDGEFPDVSDEMLLAREWIDKLPEKLPIPKGSPRVMGVDIAELGSDRTVAWIRQGPQILHLEYWQGHELMATAGRIKKLAKEHRIERVYVDEIGIGSGVRGRLLEQGVNVVGVNFAKAAKDERAFANQRAELNWRVRAAVQDGRLAMSRENRQRLAEGTSVGYGFNSKGQIQLAPKDEVRKVLGRSPDFLDALAISYASGGTLTVVTDF